MLNAILLLIGAGFFYAAFKAVQNDRVTCKGRTYARAGEPVMFWASVAVFIAFGVMLFHFGLKSEV
jgi:hypothetical protein